MLHITIYLQYSISNITWLSIKWMWSWLRCKLWMWGWFIYIPIVKVKITHTLFPVYSNGGSFRWIWRRKSGKADIFYTQREMWGNRTQKRQAGGGEQDSLTPCHAQQQLSGKRGHSNHPPGLWSRETEPSGVWEVYQRQSAAFYRLAEAQEGGEWHSDPQPSADKCA